MTDHASRACALAGAAISLALGFAAIPSVWAAAAGPAVVETLRSGRCQVGISTLEVMAATPSEKDRACVAHARALSFFASVGLYSTKPIRMRFEDAVLAPSSDGAGNRVVGMYDAGSDMISMTRLDESWLSERPYFGLDQSEELLTSVMAHEISHSMSKEFYRYTPNPDLHAQDEYVAYVAQLSTMDTVTLGKVLAALSPEDSEFSDEKSINDLVHAFKPHAFGVKSYRHFTGPSGGKPFIYRIYSGDFRPISIDGD